ncbi:MAG: CDP-alcohol phosphatidyltransferase family protein [Hyphomicrobiaceae bacterium]
MFDANIRPVIEPPLNALGRQLAEMGVGANCLTVAGFALGLFGAAFIVFGELWLALAAIMLNRLADGLDGAVARATERTDFGGFLDIALDFIFYGSVPIAFALNNPEVNALPAAVLLSSYLANGTAFLAYAVIAEKRELKNTAQGVKSIYYMSGLAEGGETIVTIFLFCLLPTFFAVIAYVFAALCYVSAAGRLLFAWHTLR